MPDNGPQAFALQSQFFALRGEIQQLLTVHTWVTVKGSNIPPGFQAGTGTPLEKFKNYIQQEMNSRLSAMDDINDQLSALGSEYVVRNWSL